jgi:hypothetical protein
MLSLVRSEESLYLYSQQNIVIVSAHPEIKGKIYDIKLFSLLISARGCVEPKITEPDPVQRDVAVFISVCV